MIRPEFPYSGSQAVIASNRVTIYSKQDAILLFGKSTIGLSSPSTINIDTEEELRVFSPKISLGANARESVILGNSFINDYRQILDSVELFATALSSINESNLSGVIDQIRYASTKLATTVADKKIELSKNLSKITFTE